MGRKHERVLHDFVVERFGGLRRTAFLMCGDWEVAEDLVHDIMSELVFDGRRGRVGDLDVYARRAVMDAFHDDWRRRFRRRDRFFFASGDEPLGVPDPTLKVSVLAALSDLPVRRRAVMVLRHFDALSVRQTAETLGIRAATVKAHDARGLVAIRESLADHPDLLGSGATEPDIDEPDTDEPDIDEPETGEPDTGDTGDLGLGWLDRDLADTGDDERRSGR